MSSFNLPYALACLYMGMTEEYDRSLTDMRDRYDQTKAFLYYNDIRSESNRYAKAVKKIVLFCGKRYRMKSTDTIIIQHSIGLMNMKGFGNDIIWTKILLVFLMRIKFFYTDF